MRIVHSVCLQILGPIISSVLCGLFSIITARVPTNKDKFPLSITRQCLIDFFRARPNISNRKYFYHRCGEPRSVTDSPKRDGHWNVARDFRTYSAQKNCKKLSRPRSFSSEKERHLAKDYIQVGLFTYSVSRQVPIRRL